MKMGVIVLSFLLLVQLQIIFASRFLPLKACGTYQIGTSSDSNSKLLYINGVLVSKDLFCKSIKSYRTNRCFISKNAESLCYEVDHSTDGRRFLQNLVQDQTLKGELNESKRKKDDKDSVFNAKYLVIGGSGIGVLILCCSVCCPCFHARKKETPHIVLGKEPNSMDSTSSVEMNSVSEKVPASPLRVPPSPSRFSMSPKLDRIGSVHLTMSQVARATQNFAPSLKLGEGGFGTVYKAHLPDGQVVAIKRAKKTWQDQQLTGPNKFRLKHVSLEEMRLAFGKYNDGDIMNLVDPQMKEAVDGEIFAKMLGLAFQCAAPTRADRPDMKVVGEQLWVIRMDYLRHGRKG
ncbi:Concanavalin A-like lectin/glucanase, subgroup [Artemisia annua]|uniref:Concanavalin A-like lectin/glucanase, subgroup n=1 Tax=Artemisia annua TaxID=35608 RepID=A0A2U1MY09_ARTAN|nr:Concanavalin A-like lectin/glucanase, subgroup [Artemisia annua]